MVGPGLFPLATFDQIPLYQANACLEEWGHKMGPIHRANQPHNSHALFFGDQPVGVTVVSTLIRERVGGAGWMNRDNTIELSRLCACRPHICRIVLRLWRELVFPFLGVEYAMSYQDADLHSGNTYRFDGWTRVGFSHSGTDSRSGRKGRNKWIWAWQKPKEPNA